MFGNTCCQNSATKSSTTVISMSPALTISRMSSSSSASGASLMMTGALPWLASDSFSSLKVFVVAAASSARTLPGPTGRRPSQAQAHPAR